MNRAVFLDRDGVINQSLLRNGRPVPPSTLEDVVLLPGVTEALEQLRQAGFLLVVVTNQPDVARGTMSRAFVEAVHSRIQGELPIDAIYTCFHDDADECACRKPSPGMLMFAARDLGLDLATSFMVGDRWRDVAAGAAAGCTTFFVDYGYEEENPSNPDFRVADLVGAAELIISMEPE